MPMFSSLLRKDILHQLRSQTFDLLVIGGGVTGVGIALDAAQRGLKVALVEKQDFAAGTSSRSTKLIHGGLRYLKQFEFALVREVGLEREIVHHNAPHIVIPEKMLLPIIKGGSLGKLPASIGLYVYDMLAGVRRKERRTMLALQATKDREPLLNQNGLLGRCPLLGIPQR
jgi:glycerol-3-phosphate dehydrogenase